MTTTTTAVTTTCTERTCSFCGRPVEVKVGGKGRKKEMHAECSIMQSRLQEMSGLMQVIEFSDDEQGAHNIKMVRNALFGLVNHNLHPSNVKKSQSAEDMYPKLQAKSARCAKLKANKEAAAAE